MAKYSKPSPEALQEEIAALTTSSLEHVKEYTDSPEQRLKLLDFMGNFYQYSLRNQLLIQSQFPGASGVGSFGFFKKMGFSVKKGEKGIRILQPNPQTYFKTKAGETKRLNDATPDEKKALDRKELKQHTVTYYKLTSVFDISQTTAGPEDYPKLFPNRPFSFEIKDPQLLKELDLGLRQIANKLNVPINDRENSLFHIQELGSAKGAFISDNQGQKEIFLSHRLSDEERIPTLIHELAHAALHDPKNLPDQGYWTTENVTSADASIKELQAEMVSYVVTKHYGIDTSEEAIHYMASWTKHLSTLEEKEEPAQLLILEDIQRTAKQFVETIEASLSQNLSRENLAAKKVQKELENSGPTTPDLPNPEEQFATYYGIAEDPAFSKEEISHYSQETTTLSEKEIRAKLALHRDEKIVDWSYTGEKTSSEIKSYKEDQQLNFRKRVIDGHAFYQVDESIEIMLKPNKDGASIDFMQFDQIGDVLTYVVGNLEQAAEKLASMNASPTFDTPFIQKFLSKDNDQKLNQHILHNQVMRETYQEETGRSMV
ncbi:ImmA/IrrE family metallo-endopeptidase [Enterococcus casseliflavus]|uniref:ArdC-like ssDNA-binding domain-containing protein n=1 Tax=Enterococcus casseliflavus TaxID=37734 RepID=UPI001432D2DB|nr:ArdC-like ssDNA-binding domain-containing protein [Enterococcus casseliflavus]NKD39758.1 ImmA/IrrE family metallo-endopeptidase [Enterococcus casseliflavus]